MKLHSRDWDFWSHSPKMSVLAAVLTCTYCAICFHLYIWLCYSVSFELIYKNYDAFDSIRYESKTRHQNETEYGNWFKPGSRCPATTAAPATQKSVNWEWMRLSVSLRWIETESETGYKLTREARGNPIHFSQQKHALSSFRLCLKARRRTSFSPFRSRSLKSWGASVSAMPTCRRLFI